MKITDMVLLGLIAAIMVIIIRPREPGIAVMVAIAAEVMIFFYLFGRVTILCNFLKELLGEIHFADEYLVILLKAVGITLVTEFGAAICRENGMLAISDGLRVLGKLSILMLGMPILTTLLRVVGGFQL